MNARCRDALYAKHSNKPKDKRHNYQILLDKNLNFVTIEAPFRQAQRRLATVAPYKRSYQALLFPSSIIPEKKFLVRKILRDIRYLCVMFVMRSGRPVVNPLKQVAGPLPCGTKGPRALSRENFGRKSCSVSGQAKRRASSCGPWSSRHD